MAYRLKAGRPLAKSILRAGLDQIERSANQLKKNPNPHDGVHQARKAFKRMRALLQLIRPIIGGKAYARENRRYRKLGRRFSGARDAQALLDVVQKLDVDSTLAARRASAAISEWLREERSRVEEAFAGEHRDSGLKALAKARRAFTRLPIQDATLDCVGLGLQAGYRDGRRCFYKAYITNEDEDFHDWRKAVQRHWRHLQLVSPAWPEALRPRVVLARELSRLLGDDHDLSVLCERVAAHCRSLLDDDEMTGFLALCRERQNQLRRLARGRGARLFGEKPKALRLRIENYWRTAPKIALIENMTTDEVSENKDRRFARSGRNKVIQLRRS